VNVRHPQIRRKLQETVPPRNPAFAAIVDAPVLFAMCARKGLSGMIGDAMATKFGDWFMYDLGLATQNLCLAAHSLGLGTVVVGWFDHDQANAILNTPSEVEVVTLIPLGHRNQKGKVPKHKPIAAFLHEDTF
jgi:nitroreductase